MASAEFHSSVTVVAPSKAHAANTSGSPVAWSRWSRRSSFSEGPDDFHRKQRKKIVQQFVHTSARKNQR